MNLMKKFQKNYTNIWTENEISCKLYEDNNTTNQKIAKLQQTQQKDSWAKTATQSPAHHR